MSSQLLDGRYQIIDRLSAGGFGQTFRAQDIRIPGNPLCVVKQLNLLNFSAEQVTLAKQLFQREAEILAQLGKHDQIPQLLAYFTKSDEFYLVEELIEGHTLDQELSPGKKWSEPQVIYLLQEVLKILVFVHQQGVIHRDIKPANIIRRSIDSKPALIDFGAIKQVQQTNIAEPSGFVTSTRIGTTGYMPTEQGQGKPRFNSDLYALGMIGIQALTGRYPHQLEEDEQTGEILWQPLVSASPALVQVLTQMTRYHFKDRYKTAAEALQALQQLTTGDSAPSSNSALTMAASQSLSTYPPTAWATLQNTTPGMQPTVAASPLSPKQRFNPRWRRQQ